MHRNKLSATGIAFFCLACLSIVESTALADDVRGYVCSVNVAPQKSYGSDGGVRVLLKSLPDCEGDVVGQISFCSDGATSTSNCEMGYLFSGTGLAALYTSLIHALDKQLIVHSYVAKKYTTYYRGQSAWISAP